MPSDGSAAPQKIAGDPLYDDISPHYIAGGRQFTWTRSVRNLDMGADTPAVMIANADGTHVHAFSPAVSAGAHLLGTDTGTNRGFDCAWIPGAAAAGPSTAFFGFALVIFAVIRRRRG